jgi:predicted NBD/HSP70 family sugar kinase
MSPEAVVAVDRDVNILALGESRLAWPDTDDLVVVKVGMGVGCAFVVDGRLVRGAHGGAGQLSAPLRERLSDPLRRLETVASGGTAAEQLGVMDVHVHTGTDLVGVIASGDRRARGLLDEAAAQLGYSLADVVGLLNPSAVVIGGALAELGEQFVAVVRRSLFAASHAFARQGLIVERGRLGVDAGIKGASLLAQDRLFEPDRVSAMTRAPESG